ncbi:MAG: hypothetical protein GTN53_23850 [Candidatus Aminicenantes bacterium]|nr:hypothetical protein [Candidatus Aminicenantes bacterium]NIT25541.1 hypothetical protein [Candidatus Aminicenantes bacterium]
MEEILRFGGIGMEKIEDFKWDEKAKETWHWFVDEWLKTVISHRGYNKTMNLLMSNENEKLIVKGSADTPVVPSDFALIISMIDCHREKWDEEIKMNDEVDWSQKINPRDIGIKNKFDYGGKDRDDGIKHYAKIKCNVDRILFMEGAENLLGSELRLYYKNKHPSRGKGDKKNEKKDETMAQEMNNDFSACIDYCSYSEDRYSFGTDIPAIGV